MHNFLSQAMTQFEAAVSYKRRVLRLLMRYPFLPSHFHCSFCHVALIWIPPSPRVREIRHEDANIRIINVLLDDIVKETKYVETQLKESGATTGNSDHRLGWVEMADLLEIASLQVPSLTSPSSSPFVSHCLPPFPSLRSTRRRIISKASQSIFLV
jgi:hypothetical protein